MASWNRRGKVRSNYSTGFTNLEIPDLKADHRHDSSISLERNGKSWVIGSGKIVGKFLWPLLRFPMNFS
jgi:hypothetical protein